MVKYRGTLTIPVEVEIDEEDEVAAYDEIKEAIEEELNKASFVGVMEFVEVKKLD